METKDKIIGTVLIITGIIFIGLGLMVMLSFNTVVDIGEDLINNANIESNQGQGENNNTDDVGVYNENNLDVYGEVDLHATEDEGSTRYIY